MHAEPWGLVRIRTARRAQNGGGVRRRSTRRSPARTGGHCQSGTRTRRTRAAPPCSGCTTSCGTCVRAAAPERAARARPLASRGRCRAARRPPAAGHEPAPPCHWLHHSDVDSRFLRLWRSLGSAWWGQAGPSWAAATAVLRRRELRSMPAMLTQHLSYNMHGAWLQMRVRRRHASMLSTTHRSCERMYAWPDDDSGTVGA